MHEIFSLLKYIASSNLINFLLMVGILYWVIKKFELMSVLDKSVEAVKDNIKKSDNAKASAIQNFNAADEELQKLPHEISKIEAYMKDKIDVFEKQALEQAKKSIENISINTDKSLSVEEDKISASVTHQTMLNSLNKSKEKFLQMLSEKPELHLKFIDESLSELEKV